MSFLSTTKVISIQLFVYSFMSCNGQTTKHDPMEQHTKIVKDKKAVVLPTPSEPEKFCETIKNIKVEKGMFRDPQDGKPLTYFVQIVFRTDDRGRIDSLKEMSHSNSIKEVTEKIVGTMRAANWRSPDVKVGTLSCDVTGDGIRNVTISSNDNYQRLDICSH